MGFLIFSADGCGVPFPAEAGHVQLWNEVDLIRLVLWTRPLYHVIPKPLKLNKPGVHLLVINQGCVDCSHVQLECRSGLFGQEHFVPLLQLFLARYAALSAEMLSAPRLWWEMLNISAGQMANLRDKFCKPYRTAKNTPQKSGHRIS